MSKSCDNVSFTVLCSVPFITCMLDSEFVHRQNMLGEVLHGKQSKPKLWKLCTYMLTYHLVAGTCFSPKNFLAASLYQDNNNKQEKIEKEHTGCFCLVLNFLVFSRITAGVNQFTPSQVFQQELGPSTQYSLTVISWV